MNGILRYFPKKVSMALLMGVLSLPTTFAGLIFTTEDNAVNSDNFILDFDDTATTSIDLEFGDALTARLRYDIMNDKFILNRDLDIIGGLKLSNNITAQGEKHIVSTPWWSSTQGETGYIKLITPIVHNEGNMFSLKITGFGYNKPGKSFTIDCAGYAYTGSTLINKGCTVIGTSLPVELAKENRGGIEVVVVRIGTPTSTWYYEQFSVEYRGWKAKDPAGFIWVKGETTPVPGVNMNKITINDGTGKIGIGVENPTESLEINGKVKIGAYTLPNTDGLADQVLATDGNGNVSWVTHITATPFISTTNVQTIDISTQSFIEFDGINFTPGMVVTIPGFDGTIDSVTVDNPNHFSMLVTPGTTETLYDIVLTIGTNSNTDFAGNGQDLLKVKDITTFIPGDGTTLWVREGETASEVATSLGKLVPTVTTSAWNKGASFGTIPANTDFLLEFKPVYMAGQSGGGYAMIGVDNADPNWNYNTIDYAIYMQNGTNYYIYENGSSKGNHGNWTTSDVLGIRRTGTTIEYLKNGDVVYTSVTPSTSSMVFDTSLYRYLGAENIKMTY